MLSSPIIYAPAPDCWAFLQVAAAPVKMKNHSGNPPMIFWRFWVWIPPLNEKAGNLPHGHLRALGIAIGLAAKPKVLLLDEPFAGMNQDETARAVQMVRQLRERGITVLVVEHDMKAVMTVSDRIVVLNFGEKIAEGRTGANPK